MKGCTRSNAACNAAICSAIGAVPEPTLLAFATHVSISAGTSGCAGGFIPELNGRMSCWRQLPGDSVGYALGCGACAQTSLMTTWWTCRTSCTVNRGAVV